MDIGGTKMEGARQFSQETPTQSAGGSTPTLGNSCSSKFSPDDARAVAMETTPNPLAYWPPPSSALPLINSSKDKVDGPENQLSHLNHSVCTDSLQSLPFERNHSESNSAVSTDVARSNEDNNISLTSTPKTLHHNLPPIAGITSSHNYRGVQKHSQNNSSEVAKPKLTPEKQENSKLQTEGCDNKLGQNAEVKSATEAKPATKPEKPNNEDSEDCEILEVPQTSAKTGNQDHVFSIPAAISTKTVSSPRAPTPFVHGLPPTEVLTLNVNSTSGLSAGSPSPSSRAAPSPQYIAPSPTASGSPSPSETSRALPSPSNLHRVLSSSHLRMSSPGEGSRMPPSPHPPSSPQRNNVSNSHHFMNPPRNGDMSIRNLSDGRPSPVNPTVEGYKETPRSSPVNQIFRMGLPKNAINPPQTSVQRIEQTDSQICRNPFELPLPKSHPQQYQQPVQHQPHFQQANQYSNNVRHMPDPQSKIELYMNAKDPQRLPENNFRTQAFKSLLKEKEDHRRPVGSHGTSYPKIDPYPLEQSQKTSAQVVQREIPKQMEFSNSKSNGASSVWNRPEVSEIGNKNTFLSAQNQNKLGMSRKIPETTHQNPVKHFPENYAGRFNGEKQSANLSQRFPPVPQSNYDLNRQIYDTMTGGSRAVQPPVSRPMEKVQQHFPPPKDQVHSQLSKTQQYYHEFSGHSKNYMPNAPVKLNEYSGSPMNSIRTSHDFRQNSFGQYNNLLDKRPPGGQPINPSLQLNETRQPQPEHHKVMNQSFTQRLGTTHHIHQSTCSTLPSNDRNRSVPPTINQSLFLPKQKALPEFDSKKLMEGKPKESLPQYVGPQPLQAKPRTPACTTPPIRSKRESPLDLSVKTVRQSADSTAKDDGEHLQNYRNFIHQPPRSEARYPVSQSSDGAGAPKIDFTPNFSGFHAENHSQISPSLHHKPETSALPPVESFKKFPSRLPTPMPQDPKIKSNFPSSKYFPSPTTSNQKLQSSTLDPSFKYPDFKSEMLKRSANEPLNHPSQPKIPKIDSWKLAFDQQIEQRLNSARMSQQNSQERALNGVDHSKATPANFQLPPNYHAPKHSISNYKGANMYPRPPVQTSATPYNPSYVQQPQCQSATPQTPQEKAQHRENLGHSPDPEQIIKQISKGVMPDHKLLQDKNVLSILRSSLEEKEAKLMQLREAAKRKEKYKEMMTADASKKHFLPFEQTSKGQQSLPPFGALTLERMCAPPSFPGHKLNLPKSVDTVKIDVEPTQKYFSSVVKNEGEKSGIPKIDLSPHDDAQGPPTDLDGLAAFLAARIRTKGELKQVGPALDTRRPPVGHPTKSEATGLTSGHHPQPTNTSGSPPKLIRESRLLPPFRRRLFSHNEEDIPTTSGAQNDEHSRPPVRDPAGIRSSSETSVFDFRESDSESEMPVLERQTLEGMRRDRKTFGSKQNVSTTTLDEVIEMEKPDVIAELDKSHPDPFWDTAFDMFVEQLEKRPPKRSIRKKKTSRATENSFDIDDSSNNVSDVMELVKVENFKESEKTNESFLVEVKKEPEEKDREVQDDNVNVHSNRVKSNKIEVLKADIKLEDEKKDSEKIVEKVKEKEKVEKGVEKTTEEKLKVKEKKKDTKDYDGEKKDIGLKTRGKAKAVSKEPDFADFESDFNDVEVRSESESTVGDDDDSLSLSGLESESSESESSQESSKSSSSSSDDSESETIAKKRIRVQTRLQTRSSRLRQVRGTGMKLRSKPILTPKPTTKRTRRRRRKKKKEEYYSGKKKPSFGDGSDFRPGWEEECYKFKQQLRMPEKLISISRPPKGSPASLPDLDPYRNSPSLDSSDVSWPKKIENEKANADSDDSDNESSKKSKGNDASNDSDNSLKLRNGKKSSSIINLLVNKYGKGNLRKKKELKAINERKSPRILPKATNKPELLPTPSLGIGKENVLKDKRRGKDGGKKKIEDSDSVLLGYFRKKTVNNFKEAFKDKAGVLPQEFSPVVLKSRTRTQTRDLKKRATLLEVFGEERPASAPPLSREEETSTDQEKVERLPEKRKPKMIKKMIGGVVTRGRGKLIRSGRPGLRSAAVLRSNKAVQISKRHLNSGRKRNIDLLRIRAMASKKFSYLVTSSDGQSQLPITKKRLKLRSVRRKFRSGFDYIRKKKKLKKDGDSADGSVKEKRLITRPTSESVEDIQNEIKNWVINKGLGETILHRAARLGYTDIAAYCLEKMDCSPSPRDNAGYTPLHEACSRGHLDIAKLLLMYGASVSESAKGGIRPLHEAAENGFTELIRLLLSYGADPLLETYTGHTALSLVTDEEARRLMQHHLADVQGNVAPVWTFQGPSSLFDPPENGYDPLCDPPSPESHHSDYELEISEIVLPPLYRLAGDNPPERRWVLLRDLTSFTKAKTKEALLKQLGTASFREMKLQEFHEQAKGCNLLNAGEKTITKASKVILVPYDEKVRQLLGVEKVVV